MVGLRVFLFFIVIQGTLWSGDINSEIEKNAIVNELYFYNESKNSKNLGADLYN